MVDINNTTYNRYIEIVMDDWGIPLHLEGRDSVYYCAHFYITNNGRCNMMDAYNYAGSMSNRSGRACERNIRHLMRWMLSSYGREWAIDHFGAIGDKLTVTNKQFILTIANEAIRLEKDYEHR